jgi:hypothetical protein
LALEPVDCWTTQVGPNHRPCGEPDRPYFSMRSPLCPKPCDRMYVFAEVLFWMEPGWAGNGSRFDPTAHNFRLAKQFEQTCEVLHSLILITSACKPFVSLSPIFDLPVQFYILAARIKATHSIC